MVHLILYKVVLKAKRSQEARKTSSKRVLRRFRVKFLVEFDHFFIKFLNI